MYSYKPYHISIVKGKGLWREDMSSYKGSETLESPKIIALVDRPEELDTKLFCLVSSTLSI
jgi:hypothetical protein